MSRPARPDVPEDSSRREFLRLGTVLGLGSALSELSCGGASASQSSASPDAPFTAPPIDVVRMGFVGMGNRMGVHLANFLALDGVEVKAVCDVVPEKVQASQDAVIAAGRARPAGYDRGPFDFVRMIAEQDLDLVFAATPWEWHVPVCLEAMRNGKHAATEVPAAYTVEDCWQLVETAERHGKHCMMMENCCYDRREMMMLNLVRHGILGELLHAECAYEHDLRAELFSTQGSGLWRRAHAIHRNGNLYPTHGLGPIAQCLDINRGNRFDYLVSMSSPSRGLQLWQEEHLAASDPRRAERYVLGDVNVSLIRTVREQTIYLVHNSSDPRPYSRINLLQGTRGIMQGYPDRIHVEGRSVQGDGWDPLDGWYAQYEHPLWTMDLARQATLGHGGMDFLEDWRLIVCLRAGLPLDQDVYDAAAWSSICELTERSVAERSRPVDIPDFTRGRWRTTPPLPIVTG